MKETIRNFSRKDTLHIFSQLTASVTESTLVLNYFDYQQRKMFSFKMEKRK